MTDLKMVELGESLSDGQISSLGARLAGIFKRDKVHLGEDDTEAVLASHVELGLDSAESPQTPPATEIKNLNVRRWLSWLDRTPGQRMKDAEAGISRLEED